MLKTPLALILLLSLCSPFASAEDRPALSDPEYQEFQEYKKFKEMKKAQESDPTRDPGQLDKGTTPVYSLEERRILEKGEISQGAYIGGGVVGTVLGLGIGHAIQGRYGEKGWIFTVGEIATATLFSIGATNCITETFSSLGTSTSSCNDGLMAVGLAGLAGFRVWELVDVWAAPASHNEEVRRLQQRRADAERSYAFYIAPNRNRDWTAGLRLRF